MRSCFRLFLFVVALTPGLAFSAAAADKITIGTGSTAGVYYQVGRAICHLLDRFASEQGIECEAPSTAGSISNLEAIRAGTLDVAVAQSDWQFHAVQGSGPFSAVGADNKLRALFSVHGEPFTLVARRDAGIEKLADLVGKRVNLGNPGSGQRATMETVMEAKNWTEDTFSLAEQMTALEMSLALCHDRVQAIIYTVGHPNPAVGKAVGLCDARVVEVRDEAIDRLVEENPYYAYTQVPGGVYAGNPDPVTTFGVKATVVASADLDAETAYLIVKTVFENLDDFRDLHPAFGTLRADAMTSDGLSAPLHEGAARYFQERGLLTE